MFVNKLNSGFLPEVGWWWWCVYVCILQPKKNKKIQIKNQALTTRGWAEQKDLYEEC